MIASFMKSKICASENDSANIQGVTIKNDGN